MGVGVGVGVGVGAAVLMGVGDGTGLTEMAVGVANGADEVEGMGVGVLVGIGSAVLVEAGLVGTTGVDADSGSASEGNVGASFPPPTLLQANKKENMIRQRSPSNQKLGEGAEKARVRLDMAVAASFVELISRRVLLHHNFDKSTQESADKKASGNRGLRDTSPGDWQHRPLERGRDCKRIP